jgi:alanine dehydrogenase
MPGSVPRTSAYALNDATLPYVLALANKGLQALRDDKHLLDGLNVHQGKITNQAVAMAHGLLYYEPALALG